MDAGDVYKTLDAFLRVLSGGMQSEDEHRFDNTTPSWSQPSHGFIDVSSVNLNAFVSMVLEKSTTVDGKVTFAELKRQILDKPLILEYFLSASI